MTDANLRVSMALDEISWANRVLLLSLAGIFFLTLYPFRFVDQHSARFLFPFCLDGWGKGMYPLDIFLNILLFVPFGFGLAEKLRERGRSKVAAFVIVYAAGALLSYAVELMQMYVPMRDSGWGDVITNSSGAAIGALMFESRLGSGLIAWFGASERAIEKVLNFTKVGVLVSLYISFWCVLARPLQKQTKLSDWTPDSFLAVGDSTSLRPATGWKGRILELDLWNQAVPADLARKITSDPAGENTSLNSIAEYRFSGAAPFQDDRHFLPSLGWTSATPPAESSSGAALDGKSWLISAGAVPALIRSIGTTGQFALRLVCQPAGSGDADGHILSLSSPSGAANLELRQHGSALEFWFRNSFSARRQRMSWIVPRFFVPSQIRNLLFSFDGSRLSLYVDGHNYGHSYELGPGVALARYIRRVKAVELAGYNYIFYAIIFFPIGCLLGFAWRRSSTGWVGRLPFILAGFLLPAFVLEWVLVDAAGRSMSLQNIWLAALLALAGSLWMNADRSFTRSLRHRQEPIPVK
jgi:glycopeptide antibiotics resistance protein